MTTSEPDRATLLRIARDALTASVSRSPAAAIELTGAAVRKAGAFVTLTNGGELRGCMGHIEPTHALGHIVARCAVAAGLSDPRFPPVRPAELPHIEIEVSILGILEEIVAIDDIEIGRHGLIVAVGVLRGLLLPQVATEWRWDRATFVERTCRKAGLPTDAWRNGAALWRFEAEVFDDSDVVGQVGPVAT